MSTSPASIGKIMSSWAAPWPNALSLSSEIAFSRLKWSGAGAAEHRHMTDRTESISDVARQRADISAFGYIGDEGDVYNLLRVSASHA